MGGKLGGQTTKPTKMSNKMKTNDAILGEKSNGKAITHTTHTHTHTHTHLHSHTHTHTHTHIHTYTHTRTISTTGKRQIVREFKEKVTNNKATAAREIGEIWGGYGQ